MDQSNDINFDQPSVKALREAQAFAKVFGVDDETRSAEQRIVWRKLVSLSGYERPTWVAGPTGAMDPLRAAHNDGARWLFISIKELIKNASKEDTVKPKSRR